MKALPALFWQQGCRSLSKSLLRQLLCNWSGISFVLHWSRLLPLLLLPAATTITLCVCVWVENLCFLITQAVYHWKIALLKVVVSGIHKPHSGRHTFQYILCMSNVKIWILIGNYMYVYNISICLVPVLQTTVCLFNCVCMLEWAHCSSISHLPLKWFWVRGMCIGPYFFSFSLSTLIYNVVGPMAAGLEAGFAEVIYHQGPIVHS